MLRPGIEPEPSIQNAIACSISTFQYSPAAWWYKNSVCQSSPQLIRIVKVYIDKWEACFYLLFDLTGEIDIKIVCIGTVFCLWNNCVLAREKLFDIDIPTYSWSNNQSHTSSIRNRATSERHLICFCVSMWINNNKNWFISNYTACQPLLSIL